MSKTSKKQDYPSDSDLSLQLSDASSLSSDSDLSASILSKSKRKQPKKPKKKVKSTKKKSSTDNSQYCTCRKGYDGKEFMIECDDCQEWFHGACVGLKPNSVTDHYFCKSCTSKRHPTSGGKTSIPPSLTPPKTMIVLPPISKSMNDHIKKAPPPPKPAVPPAPIVPVIANVDEDDEDLDDICVLCDGDCTCGAVQESVPAFVAPPLPPPIPEIQTKIIIPVPKKSAPKKPVPKKPMTKKPLPKKPVAKKPVAKKPVPKKTGKAIPSSKKFKIAKAIQNHNSSSSEDSSSSEESSDEEMVIERVGIETKPKKSTVKRGKSATLLANMKSLPPAPRKGKGKKMNTVKFISSEEDSDEELIVDDLDDLLETMSPLSEHSSNESVLQSEEEFFTDEDDNATMSPTSYGSSIHIDSGDDEDIENEETQKIINELTLDTDEEGSDMEEVLFGKEDEGGIFVEDNDDDDDDDDDENEDEDDEDDDEDEEEGDEDEEHIPNFYYNRHESHWSSSEDEEDDEEFDYTAIPEEEDNNALLPLLDSEGNFYDSIAAAFMQAFSIHADTTTTTAQPSGTTTPAAVTLGEDYQLSPFELANALTALSAAEHVFLRRPSLPSSTVSAAQRMRGSQDLSTSDLRAIVSDDLTLSLEPIQESAEEQSSPTTNDNQLFSNEMKLQEQILDILKNTQKEDQEESSALEDKQQQEKLLQPIITNNSTRQILPKPSGSGDSYFPNMLSQTALEHHIQDVLAQSIESSQSQKRKSTMSEPIEKKKLRGQSTSTQPMSAASDSPTPIMDDQEQEEEPVSMDDLVDTSQLYTRSLSRSPSPDMSEDDNPYSRDLSRWQRIPIGAFRLMRSKNKLWLER